MELTERDIELFWQGLIEHLEKAMEPMVWNEEQQRWEVKEE